MQRIFNLEQWSRLDASGDGLHFTNAKPRVVRVEVNAPQRSRIDLIDHSGEVHFLALVEGRDTLEFHSLGAFSLTTDTDGVMVYTADGVDISYQAIAPVIFTRIMQRRVRNPELEYIAHLMQKNMERSLEQQAEILARKYATAEAARLPLEAVGVLPQPSAKPEPLDSSVLHSGTPASAGSPPGTAGEPESGASGGAAKPAG